MKSLLVIIARWLLHQITDLGWRQFIILMADTAQKLGIGGLGLGIYQKNEDAISIGAILILASGIVILIINRRKK